MRWLPFAQRGVHSLEIFLTTVLHGIASLLSAIALWRARKLEIHRAVRWYSMEVTCALLMAAIYLAWWGVLGLRTWS